jgi:hypothetical protein
VRAPTLVDTVSILAVLTLAAIVAVPQRRVREIMRNEDQIVADLRDFEQRLADHQQAAARDTDADGTGEYAPLGEILGARGSAAVATGAPGIYELDGYLFAVLVPGGRKTPVLAGSADAVTDWAEVTYAIVAWPARPGESGMSAYMATPHGMLRHQIDGYPYDAAPPPLTEWAMIDLAGEKPRRAAYQGSAWRVPIRLPGRDRER